MAVQLIQTFTPILHTGIEVGIGEKVVNWLEEYWWIPVLFFIAIIGYFVWKKYSEQTDDEEPEKVQ